MKGKFTNYYAILAILFLFYSFSSSAPIGRTGAPGDSNCTNCHGSSGSFDGNVTITGLPASITPNQTYSITVASTVISGSPSRTGFSMVTLDGSDSNTGVLASNSANTNLITSGSGRVYFGHAPATNFNGNTSISWTVDWTAPAGPAGEVITMYTNSLLANGGGSSGDNMFHGEATGTIAGGGGGSVEATITNTTDVSCLGGNDGSAMAEGSTGSGNYAYLWSNGGMTATINDLTTGNYSVTVTDMSNGAIATTMTFVDQPNTAVNVNIISQQDIDCNSPTGSASANGTGGTGNISYNWSNGANGQTTALNAGPFSVTATDVNGCTDTASGTILEDITTPTADAGANMSIDCVNSVVILDGTNSTPSMTYSWSTTDGNILAGANTMTPTVDAAGTYTLIVTDSNNGCSNTSFVTVTGDTTPPIASAGNNMQIDCNTPTVTLDGTASSDGNVSYSWTTTNGNIINGSTTMTSQVDASGTYTLTVTDNTNGCTASDDVIVTENINVPIANAGSTMEISCTAATVTLDGTSSSGGNVSYSWTTINGNIVNGGNTTTPEVSSAGIYTLIVTDNMNGCSASDDVTVTENANIPNANAGSSMTLTCINSTIMLDGTGSSAGANITYQWTTSNGNIVNGGNTLNPTIDAPGQYCIEVADNANGCINIACVIVSADFNIPTVSIAVPNDIDCVNACVTLDATASSQGNEFTYQWTGESIVNGGTTLTPEVCEGGTYQLVVTNTNNGCTTSAVVDVNENTVIPTLSINISGDLNCNNSSVTISSTSSTNNSSFDWTGPNGFTSNIANPSVSVVGTYTLIVTDNGNGCIALIQGIVNETPAPAATISMQTNVDCNGQNTGSATAVATAGAGNFTYEWSTGGMMATETGLTAGTYTVTATDSDQCTATAMVTITEPSAISVNASATGVTGIGMNDGTATANPMGGTSGYTYAWSNMEMTQTITDLSPATYTVSVTDANGCSAVEIVVVSNFDCSDLSLDFNTNDANCNDGNEGSITAVLNGGMMPITYMWSNGGMMETILSLTAGTYSVTATDANNCQLTGSATIAEPTAIFIMATGTDVSCNAGMDGTATVTATGGTGVLVYTWDNGMEGPMIMDLGTGVYTVTATDENQCTATTSVTTNEPMGMTLSVITTNETANGANDGTALADVSGGVGAYTFVWSNSENMQMIFNLSPGDYCVTVTDANGCSAEACGFVMMFGCGDVTSVVNSTSPTCFGGSDGSAVVASLGGTEPYTYAWSNGAIGSNVSNLQAGVYTVTCTDATDCSAMIDVMVSQPDELMVSVFESGNVLCESNDDGYASAGATGGILGYSYLWNNGDTTTTITDLAPGTYSLTVTDTNLCTAETSVVIELIPDTEMPVVLTNDVMIFLDANGMASVTPAMVDAGSTDNCGIESIVLDLTEFDCDDLGANEIVVAVLDNAGLCASGTATVMVNDTIAPVLTCPVNIEAEGCGLVIVYDLPTATDNCSTNAPFIVNGLPSGANFSSGITTVEWAINDLFGNAATCSFTVTLENDFSAAVVFTPPSCTGFSNGTTTAELSNGTLPFTYEWNDPAMQMTQTATNLTAGEYIVTITDATGCATVATIEVVEPELIDIQIIEVIAETNSDMDGAITVEVTGGTGNTFTYQWFMEGNLFSEDQNLTDLEAGEYVLFVTDPSDCMSSDTVVVDMNVGIFENNDEQQIALYPNPTTGEFQLDIQLSIEKSVSVSVFDVTGKTVFTQKEQPILKENLSIDLNGFSDGVYLVRVQVGEDVLMRRVILQK